MRMYIHPILFRLQVEAASAAPASTAPAPQLAPVHLALIFMNRAFLVTFLIESVLAFTRDLAS